MKRHVSELLQRSGTDTEKVEEYIEEEEKYQNNKDGLFMLEFRYGIPRRVYHQIARMHLASKFLLNDWHYSGNTVIIDDIPRKIGSCREQFENISVR